MPKTKKTPEKKQVKKTKAKYNWPLIKQEFMTSDYLEVQGFFKAEYGAWSGTISTRTTGWIVEKKEFIKAIYEKTLEKVSEERSKKYADFLGKIMDGLMADGETADDMKVLSISEKKAMWEIFMVMNGQATKVTENKNTNTVIEVDKLSEDEQESLKEKLKVNGLI